MGYALISTLLVIALVAVVVIGLLGIQRRDTGRVGLDRDLVEARANALYALDVALGELQRYAGPDQAVTGPAELLDKGETSVANPRWTGVWHSTPEAREGKSKAAFLVSGNEHFEISEDTTSYPDGYVIPDIALDPESRDVVALVQKRELHEDDAVLVPLEQIVEQTTGRKKGHFGYWVGDEGVKARVNIKDPFHDMPDDEDKRHRFTVAQRNGIEAEFPDIDPLDERLSHIATSGEFSRIDEVGALMRDKFHHMTTHGVGLLTDTRNGGLRRDLTTAFHDKRIFEREFGAKETDSEGKTVVSEDDLYTLDTDRLDDFYLVPEILQTATSYSGAGGHGPWSGGPNWANLREYWLLHRADATHFPFLPHPRCGVKMRHYSFNPYKHGLRGDKLDYYHRNSPVCPILSRAQMNVRLRTRLVSEGEGGEEDRYRLDLEIQPVIGLWNPHNVPLSERVYRFDWEISVFLRLNIDGTERRYDLYRLWEGSNYPWFSLNSQNVEFQPGEFRLFTVDSRKELRQRVTLVPRWSEGGAFWVSLPEDPSSRGGAPLIVRGDSNIEVLGVGLVAATESEGWSNDLKELQKHNTFMAVKYGETLGSPSSAVESSSVRMNNLWKADDESGPLIVPEEGDGIPPFRPSQHTQDPVRLASWSYYLRTSREDDLGQRNFIDSNVRAIVANSRWDGSVEDRGWRSMGWLNDGPNRALLPPGNEEPEADSLNRYRGFGGDSIGATGQTHVILFDVPREPLLSLGQLQHANMGRYNNEPSFVVGNSYHNVRIPPDQILVRDFAEHDTNGLYNSAGLDVFDLSYRVNEALWDSWFFAPFDPRDGTDDIEAAKEGLAPLANSRYRINDPSDLLIEEIEDASDDQDSFDVLGARFLVEGAFNVNSTSVPAWKTVLSSLRDVELPVYDPVDADLSGWEKGSIVFSRLGNPFAGGYKSGDSKTEDNYWRGFRELTEEQVQMLAEEIVRQVKLRGPFRSLSDFVNRSLEDEDPSDEPYCDTRTSGALQAALDRTEGINRGLEDSVASPVVEIPDSANEFYDVPEESSQGTGFPGYLMQGDVLQALGPVLSARSDTFRIRAYGDKVVVPRGHPELETVTARAWCEAIVQRVSEPVETLDGGPATKRDLIQRTEDIEEKYRGANRPYFGRRFKVVSFRWLEKDEL